MRLESGGALQRCTGGDGWRTCGGGVGWAVGRGDPAHAGKRISRRCDGESRVEMALFLCKYQRHLEVFRTEWVRVRPSGPSGGMREKKVWRRVVRLVLMAEVTS